MQSPELMSLFDSYLKKYGAISHLPSVPSFEESPADIIRKLQGYLAQDESPAALADKLGKERENQVRKASEKLAGYPGPVREEFETYLKAAQYSYMLITEHTWWIEGRVPHCVRRISEAGHRLLKAGAADSADDVFYLMSDEITVFLENLPDITDTRELVRKRKKEEERFGESDPPEFIGEPSSEPLPENIFTKISASLMPMPAASKFEFRHGELKGVPGSPGTVTGTARIIRSVSEGAEKLRHGDIMIAGATMPNWVPLFSLISGLITDTGGALCHSAIVAREYGIPAVVGAGVATSVIKEGDTVEVDGDKGIVRMRDEG